MTKLKLIKIQEKICTHCTNINLELTIRESIELKSWIQIFYQEVEITTLEGQPFPLTDMISSSCNTTTLYQQNEVKIVKRLRNRVNHHETKNSEVLFAIQAM